MEKPVSLDPQEINTRGELSTHIQNFANEAGISLIGKIFGRILNLGVEVIIARFLGPALYGLYAIGSTILRLVGIFLPLGLNNGVIWFSTPYWKKDTARQKGVVVSSIGGAAISGITIGLLFFIAAQTIANFYKEAQLVTVIRWFSITFPLLALLRVAAASTRVTQKMKYTVLSEDFTQPFINLVFIIIFFAVGVKLVGALAASFISFAIALLIAIYYVYRIFFKSVSPIIFPVSPQKLLSYSVPTAFTGFLGTANNWVDRLIIGIFLPVFAVGVYQSASQTSMYFVIILYAINSIFAPIIADLYYKNKMLELSELYKVSTKWGVYLGVPAYIVLVATASITMKTIFGNEYIGGAIPMVILNTGQLINLFTGAVGYLLIMTGNQNIWLVVTFISLGINITLNTLLIPIYGIIGSAIGTSISISLMYIVGLLIVRKRLHLWPYDRRYIKGLIATIMTIAVVFIIVSLKLPHNLLTIILASIGSYLSFFLTLRFLGLEQEDLDILKLLVRKLN